VQFCARDIVAQKLREQDRLQRNFKGEPGLDPNFELWKETVADLSRWTRVLSSVASAAPIPKSKRTPRHSKRSDMKGLPVDWRERLIVRMPNYHPIVLTAAVCGCRPEELVAGVTLTVEAGMLVAIIPGAKCSDRSGQPWRRLTWSVHDKNRLVQFLISEVVRVGGDVLVTLKDAKQFSGAVSAAARREWPERARSITPYCFRHAFASDAKAAGASRDDVSRMLGHCVDITKSLYGHAKMGSRKGVAPLEVHAERDIRISKPKQFQAKRAANQNADIE
jgi:integrase